MKSGMVGKVASSDGMRATKASANQYGKGGEQARPRYRRHNAGRGGVKCGQLLSYSFCRAAEMFVVESYVAVRRFAFVEGPFGGLRSNMTPTRR